MSSISTTQASSSDPTRLSSPRHVASPSWISVLRTVSKRKLQVGLFRQKLLPKVRSNSLSTEMKRSTS